MNIELEYMNKNLKDLDEFFKLCGPTDVGKSYFLSDIRNEVITKNHIPVYLVNKNLASGVKTPDFKPVSLKTFPELSLDTITTEVDGDSLMVVTPKGIIYGSKIIKKIPSNKDVVFEVVKMSNGENILIKASDTRYAVFDGFTSSIIENKGKMLIDFSKFSTIHEYLRYLDNLGKKFKINIIE